MKKMFLLIMSMLCFSNASANVYHGKASWYSVASNRGTVTASGQKLSDNALTAAHKTLKLGTKVKITNLTNNKSIVVVVNDRGPYIKGRIIDLTKRGAQELGFLKKGVENVKVEVVGKI